MKSVNADIDGMNEFMKDIKRHKEDFLSKQKMIIYKLNNLGHGWKDKAYEKYKEEFVKENILKTKQLAEFYDLKMKDLQLKITELEEFLDKLNRR
jgi:hypothetical protein